jgi:hypothetical protein
MTNSKKYFYAWVGQNATTGTPNPVTGRMSLYGKNYKFDNRADRDAFVDNYYDHNGNNSAVKCNMKTLRSYNLGSSVYNFETDIENTEIMGYDHENDQLI